MASEDQQKWQEASSHVLCANNCGFFGSPTTLNLCSKCYKDHCLKGHQISSAKIAVENTFSESSSSFPAKLSGDVKISSPRQQSVNFSPESPRHHAESFSPESSSLLVKTSGEDILTSPCHQSETLGSDLAENDVHAPHAPLIDFHASVFNVDAPLKSVDTPLSDVDAPLIEEKKVVRKRCGSCNKRVGLTGFTCKCGTLFCGTHRYPEKHECSFDFKTAGKEAIKRENPVVKASKLDKI